MEHPLSQPKDEGDLPTATDGQSQQEAPALTCLLAREGPGIKVLVIESQKRKVTKRRQQKPRGWLLLLLLSYTSKAERYIHVIHIKG